MPAEVRDFVAIMIATVFAMLWDGVIRVIEVRRGKASKLPTFGLVHTEPTYVLPADLAPAAVVETVTVPAAALSVTHSAHESPLPHRQEQGGGFSACAACSLYRRANPVRAGGARRRAARLPDPQCDQSSHKSDHQPDHEQHREDREDVEEKHLHGAHTTARPPRPRSHDVHLTVVVVLVVVQQFDLVVVGNRQVGGRRENREWLCPGFTELKAKRS